VASGNIYICGFPLDFSYSLFFQPLALAKNHTNVLYHPFRNSLDDFRNILLREETIGANITAPFKESAIFLCDELSETAKICGSINTISKKNGKIIGNTTDGEGLVLWLEDSGFMEKEIMILGNGGASRSIAYSLFKRGVELSIFGRKNKGWEDNFGKFKDLSTFTPGKLAINTMPFMLHEKRVLEISYSDDFMGDAAFGMLAMQGFLAFKDWFETDLNRRDFYGFLKTTYRAVKNRGLILSCCNPENIK